MASYNKAVFGLSKYIEGFYCKDEESINSIRNDNARIVLQLLASSFPLHETIGSIMERTDMQQGTVEGSVKALKDSHLLKRDDRRDRSQKTQRRVFKYSIENMNSVLNEYFGYGFEFAPGYVKYNPTFLQVWNRLVEQKDQEEIYTLLVTILRKAVTKIEGSNDPILKELKPRSETQDGKKMHCTSCGTNHELRDFLRAILLRLIDQLEIDEHFISFLDEKHFFDKDKEFSRQIYVHSKQEAITKQKQPKDLSYEMPTSKTEIRQPKERDVAKLRILSIEKDTGKNEIDFVAITDDREFRLCTVDSTLVTDDMISDSMIECIPNQGYTSEEGCFLFFDREESYIKTIEDDESFPRLSTMVSKISDIEGPDPPIDAHHYVLEGIMLHKPKMMDVTGQDGKTIPLFYTTIGDNTGQIKLQEFNGLTLNKLSIGDRIQVIGAQAFYGYGDELTLHMTLHSSIVKISIDSETIIEKVYPNKEIFSDSGTVKVNRKQIKDEIQLRLDKLEFFNDYTEAYVTISNDSVADELQLSENGSRAFQDNKRFALTDVRPRSDFPFLKPNVPPNTILRTGVVKFQPIDHTKSNAKFQFMINRKPLRDAYDFTFDVSIARINQK